MNRYQRRLDNPGPPAITRLVLRDARPLAKGLRVVGPIGVPEPPPEKPEG